MREPSFPRRPLIIADEPVSALDVSVQAQVLNLMMDLREQLKLSMLFISHDIGVIGQISSRVAVMYMGRVVEHAATRAILDNPRHPYTRSLVAAIPKPDPSQRIIGAIELGEPPSLFKQPPRLCLRPALPDGQRSLPGRRSHASVCRHGR